MEAAHALRPYLDDGKASVLCRARHKLVFLQSTVQAGPVMPPVLNPGQPFPGRGWQA